MPSGKQGHDNDRGQDAEHSELSETKHRPGALMAVPARFQPGPALEVVARAGEEEVVNAVRDGKRQRTPDNGQDRPLRPVPRLVTVERPQLLFADGEPRREEDVAQVAACAPPGGAHAGVCSMATAVRQTAPTATM